MKGKRLLHFQVRNNIKRKEAEMMQTVLYIILFALVVFTILNILSQINGRKRKKAYDRKFSSIFQPLENELLDVQKKNSCSFNTITRVMNDRDEGIVAVRDDSKGIIAIAMKDFLLTASCADMESVRIEEDGKTGNMSVIALIKGETYTFAIATKGYARVSFSRMMLKRMAENLKNALTRQEGKNLTEH